MKKLIFILMAMVSLAAFSQEKLTEKDVIKNSHIDFTKQYISFVISGMIEIDGHIFKNDTCKSPILYRSNLDEVVLIDSLSGTRYEHRTCGKEGCKIIHLTKKESILFHLGTITPIWQNLSITN